MTDEEIKRAAQLIDEIATLESRKDEELVVAFQWKEGPGAQGYMHFPIPLGDVSGELRSIVQREIARRRADLDALRDSDGNPEGGYREH